MDLIEKKISSEKIFDGRILHVRRGQDASPKTSIYSRQNSRLTGEKALRIRGVMELPLRKATVR